MAVIDIQIQPSGSTRIMFDCRKAKPAPDDERRIEQAIAHSLAEATQVQVAAQAP
jgi:hypothetical protein